MTEPRPPEYPPEPTGVPRWIKVAVIAVAVVILLVVVILFIGGGGGGHGPSRHG